MQQTRCGARPCPSSNPLTDPTKHATPRHLVPDYWSKQAPQSSIVNIHTKARTPRPPAATPPRTSTPHAPPDAHVYTPTHTHLRSRPSPRQRTHLTPPPHRHPHQPRRPRPHPHPRSHSQPNPQTPCTSIGCIRGAGGPCWTRTQSGRPSAAAAQEHYFQLHSLHLYICWCWRRSTGTGPSSDL